MRHTIVYEIMLEDGSKEVCFKCATLRVNNEGCFVHTNIEEFKDNQYFVCQDCNEEI